MEIDEVTNSVSYLILKGKTYLVKFKYNIVIHEIGKFFVFGGY